MNTKKIKITPQSENFSKWYLDVVREAELAENSEVRGCGIVRPYGFKIWELIKAELARRIEKTGVENVYFPLFIPMENLQAEKDHVEGFSPELAVVTHGGGEELVNQLAVRPTSETSMYKTYAKWIQSHKDLPLRLNQWNNVVRWEKRPRPFLRWSEFLWQEGHTAFASKEEAIAEMWQMLKVYKEMYEFMAIPVIEGRKSELEKFAGAEITTTVEIMVRDGKAIQGATSHYLGTNFAKVFDITYMGEDEQEHLAHQNSWGFTWRSIGALIMAHGDDHGLRLPPNIAPVQVAIIPIPGEDAPEQVYDYCRQIAKELEGFRVKIDDRKEHSPGFKFNYWELKGAPLRIEVGKREIATGKLPIFRRDKNEREAVSRDGLKAKVEQLLAGITKNLFDQAQGFADAHMHHIGSIDQIKDQKGFFVASWSETAESERQLKEKYKMVSRVLPRDWEDKAPSSTKCFITGKKAKHDWIFAKSY